MKINSPLVGFSRPATAHRMGTLLIGLVLCGQTIQFAGDKPLTKLEQAVRAGPRIHEVNKAAAKPGERPHTYASPGREKHGKPPPPGKVKP